MRIAPRAVQTTRFQSATAVQQQQPLQNRLNISDFTPASVVAQQRRALDVAGVNLQQTQQTQAATAAVFPFPPAAQNAPEALARITAMRDYWAAQPAPQNKYGVFATAYVELFTGMMSRSAQLRAQGTPEALAQADGIDQMLTPFANEYFEAFAANQAQNPPPGMTPPAGVPTTVPAVWQVHFAECQNPNSSMAALLSTAMNAHILYDLPRVIIDLNNQGLPGYQLGNDAAFDAAKQNFLAYGDLFGAVAPNISSALQARYGSNDVTTAAAVARLFGADESGVATATAMLRSTAFDLARDLFYQSAGGDGNLTADELDLYVAQFSQQFAAQIDAAVDGLEQGQSASAVVNGVGAAFTMFWSLDQLARIPHWGTPRVPTPSPPAANATQPAPP